jgi:hypothetical protein
LWEGPKTKLSVILRSRLVHKLTNWNVNFLSQAGKEVLLKAVVQAIPTYCMGVFQLPITLCKDLNALMQNFWWSHMLKTSRIHWMSWERMGRSKAEGGLGFRDLVLFNLALLAKQGWHIIQNPKSLTSRILKAKYYPTSSFLEAQVGSRASFIWRSICTARELLSHGLLWRVGNGQSINVWTDRWIPRPITYSIQSPLRILGQQAVVEDLIDQRQGSWKSDLIHEVFMHEEAKILENIPLSPCLPLDRLIWKETKDGKFTVQSAYHLGKSLAVISGGQSSFAIKDQGMGKSLWTLRVPKQVKMFT